MNKQQALYEQYIQFKETKKVQHKKSMKESIKIALGGALPTAIAAVTLIIQEPVSLKILGFVLWAVVFGIIGFIACKMLVLDQQKFQPGKDWENSFKGYLTECGVDMGSAEFPYRHYTSYIRHGGGLSSVPVVYWTKAKVNGVATSVDVQELGGKLRVFTTDTELTPIP